MMVLFICCFVGFLEEMDTVRRHSVAEVPIGKNRNTPVLVHCGAGVGRTGVAIACDVLLTSLDHNIVRTLHASFIVRSRSLVALKTLQIILKKPSEHTRISGMSCVFLIASLSLTNQLWLMACDKWGICLAPSSQKLQNMNSNELYVAFKVNSWPALYPFSDASLYPHLSISEYEWILCFYHFAGGRRTEADQPFKTAAYVDGTDCRSISFDLRLTSIISRTIPPHLTAGWKPSRNVFWSLIETCSLLRCDIILFGW